MDKHTSVRYIHIILADVLLVLWTIHPPAESHGNDLMACTNNGVGWEATAEGDGIDEPGWEGGCLSFNALKVATLLCQGPL